MITTRADKLKSFCTRILVNAGKMSERDAEIVVDNLIFANIQGVDTHGVTRMAAYLEFIKAGVANLEPTLPIVRDGGATVLVDAQNALGQIGAQRGMELAIERAEEHGVAWVSVANSGHIGALAYWAMMALGHDMIGLCFTSTANIMAAYGSRECTVGNTPISIAAPSDRDMPLVLDMALSVAARGHLSVAAREGTPIPDGWAIDEEGVPTNDPVEGLKGSVLPIGNYKGSGLSIMIEVMTAILTNSQFGSQKGTLVPPSLERPIGLSHTFIALKIDRFIPVDRFKERVGVLMDQVKNSKKAKNIDEILLPGEKEYRNKIARSRQGIPISDSLIKELRGMAEKYDVPMAL